MSADLELLKLAAKAARYDVNFEDYDDPEDWFAHGYDVDTGDVDQWWNPLRSDGDALRLAVRIGIPMNFCHASGAAWAVNPWNGEEFIEPGAPDFKGLESSLRRAIVRAASAIGKAMP